MLDRSEPKKPSVATRAPIDWKPVEKPAEPAAPVTKSTAADPFEELEKATTKREGFFGRWRQAAQEQLTASRGPGRLRSPAEEAGDDPNVTADDLAIRRAKNIKPQRMIVPEGVIIEGSMTSGSETEIAGKIEGDVTVDGRLFLGASALITGNVRSSSCRVEGLVEGKVECSEELELGRTGRLNADALGGKEVTLAGQVFGNVITGGVARLLSTARLNGNIRARRVVIEEGAVFNGVCTMRPPAQRGDAAPEK
jgi:cytoskeletal protein CcmA (bactofilin family)